MGSRSGSGFAVRAAHAAVWIAGGVLAFALGGAPGLHAQSNACGGPQDEDCAAGEYCRYEPGQCGEPGAQGTCEVLPEFCTQIYEPVCGCDGETHSNACEAARAGVAVKETGSCEPGD